MFVELGCPNYIRAVTTNLLVLHWLKNVDHPAWVAYTKDPSCFSEEKGECSLSFLITAAKQCKLDLERWRNYYTMLPHCAQVCVNLTDQYQRSKHLDRKPIDEESDEVTDLVNHFVETIQQLDFGTWQFYAPVRTTAYPPQAANNLLNVPATSCYSLSFNFATWAKYLDTVKRKVWTFNYWGICLADYFMDNELVQQQRAAVDDLFTSEDDSNSDSDSSHSSEILYDEFSSDEDDLILDNPYGTSSEHDNFYISLQPEFFVDQNNLVTFYS